MLNKLIIILILIALTASTSFPNDNNCSQRKNDKPNIVIIMADDLGWNDVSYNGMNQFITKNIDALSYHGITIKKMYTPAMCSPSRAAMLTGKYPMRTGMQYFVPRHDDEWGLCPKEKLMSHVLQDCGYSTNLIGKWHLGHFKKTYLPKLRGFDYTYGYLGGYTDYFDHKVFLEDRNYTAGLDFLENLEHNFHDQGSYLTDLLTDKAVGVINNHDQKKPLFLLLNQIAPHTGNEAHPMQAPQEEINKFSYIGNLKRRTYAAMVSKLDESVGRVVEALSNNGMLCNSIVIFYSDNGAPTVALHSNSGSNAPLKGMKNSPWEGAIHVPFVIFSPKLQIQGYNYPHPMHITDLLPTLATASKCHIPNNIQLDGIDHWNTLSFGKTYSQLVPNRKILHNLDEVTPYVSYLSGKWKYVNGTTVNGLFDKWLGNISIEIDPHTENYAKIIQNSSVSKTITSLKCTKHQKFNLTKSKIRYLRGKNEIICRKNRLLDKNAKYECNALESPCLFDIDRDPCERYNLAKDNPQIMKLLEKDIKKFRDQLVPSVFIRPSDPLSNPAFHNGTWTWWQSNSTIDFDMPGTYCVASI